jgi:endonuclease YncB( thermonuclease family)
LRIKIAILLAIVAMCASYTYSKSYGDVEVTSVNYVHDGDTFYVDINQYPPVIGKHMPIRIADIDTPEIGQPGAQEAKQYTAMRLEEGAKVVLKGIRRGKYFRLVAEVYVDGSSLGNELVQKGLAKQYKYKGERK